MEIRLRTGNGCGREADRLPEAEFPRFIVKAVSRARRAAVYCSFVPPAASGLLVV